MNKAKRFLTMLLVAISVFVMAVPAFAAPNTGNTEHSGNVTTSFSRIGNTRTKTNTTPCYLKITEATYTHAYVAVMSYTGVNNVYANLTALPGVTSSTCGYVACRMGLDLSLHNLIMERGYNNAILAFRYPSGNGLIKFLWSPDSTKTYISVT